MRDPIPEWLTSEVFISFWSKKLEYSLNSSPRGSSSGSPMFVYSEEKDENAERREKRRQEQEESITKEGK